MTKQEITARHQAFAARQKKRNAETRSRKDHLKAQIMALKPSERTAAVIDMVKAVKPTGAIFADPAQMEYNLICSAAKECQHVDMRAVLDAMPREATCRMWYGCRP